MKTIGVRAIRENPDLFNQCAAKGEYLTITSHNKPISISVPFDDDLIRSGAHTNIAINLFENETLTLTKAASLAKMSTEAFMKVLSSVNCTAVNYPADELDSDLEALNK